MGLSSTVRYDMNRDKDMESKSVEVYRLNPKASERWQKDESRLGRFSAGRLLPYVGIKSDIPDRCWRATDYQVLYNTN